MSKLTYPQGFIEFLEKKNIIRHPLLSKEENSLYLFVEKIDLPPQITMALDQVEEYFLDDDVMEILENDGWYRAVSEDLLSAYYQYWNRGRFKL